MNPHEHTLADELHPCVMDLARIHHILDHVTDILHNFDAPHVELEPKNVIIDPHDGISVLHGRQVAREPWAAPETLRDGTLTIRSNIYSLGAMLGAMLANRPETPSVARDLVTGCMRPDPNVRPGSIAEVRDRIRALRWSAQGRPRGAWHRRFTPKDEREATLVEALRKTPSDDATRAVYADWLEENGDAERAGFLRRLDSEAGPASSELTSWRAIVSRASILGCKRSDCPARWHALLVVEGIDNRRSCANCRHTIDYCTSVEDAENHGSRSAPIVLDAMLPQQEATSAFMRGRIPLRTYNPPPPLPPPPLPVPPTTNPPPQPPVTPSVPNERNPLARFFGWLRRK